MKDWHRIDQFVEIKSPWLNIIGEKWQDDQENLLDYWRVEKVDSVIILTIWQNQLIFPKKTYRVGIADTTLDFAGGRLRSGFTREETAYYILKKELNLHGNDLNNLTAINQIGWAINSSFSNQRLYGFIAEIKGEIILDESVVGATYPVTKSALNYLLEELTCLQCRVIFLEWLRLKD